MSNTFNVSDLSPYHGDDDDQETRTSHFQGGGGDDVVQPKSPHTSTTPSPPSGPMTRARTKALHDKVNSLLSTCDLSSTLDGLLLHSDTLCILRYEPQHGHMEEGQEDGQGPTKKLLIGPEYPPGTRRTLRPGRSLRPAPTGVSGDRV